MTISELNRKYYFHDSLLEEIVVDKSNSTVAITIDFCFWAQDGYRNDDPETGIVILEFKGVKNYPEIDGKLDSYSILWTMVQQDGSWKMIVLDDETDKCYEVSIQADEVSINIEGIAYDK